MGLTVFILPVVVPVLFWSMYHYHKDRHLPEPVGHLVIAFLLGVGAAWIGKGLYLALDLVGLRYDALDLAMNSPWSLFAYSVLAIGPIEELAKMVPFLLVIVRFEEFDEPLDGIIYASFIALGFSAVENLYYLEFLTPADAIARGFAGPMVHILFASIWGYLIGCAYLNGRHLAITVVLSLLSAALLHGIYDFITLSYPPTALPLAALLILAVWVWRMRLIKRLRGADGVGRTSRGKAG